MNRETALKLLQSSGAEISIANMADTFVEMKKLFKVKNDKTVWDKYIHEILKAVYNYDEVMEYIKENNMR